MTCEVVGNPANLAVPEASDPPHQVELKSAALVVALVTRNDIFWPGVTFPFADPVCHHGVASGKVVELFIIVEEAAPMKLRITYKDHPTSAFVETVVEPVPWIGVPGVRVPRAIVD
jgi:hypothetical protein